MSTVGPPRRRESIGARAGAQEAFGRAVDPASLPGRLLPVIVCVFATACATSEPNPGSGSPTFARDCAVEVRNETLFEIDVTARGEEARTVGRLGPGERTQFREPCSAGRVAVTAYYTDGREVGRPRRPGERTSTARTMTESVELRPGEVVVVRFRGRRSGRHRHSTTPIPSARGNPGIR